MIRLMPKKASAVVAIVMAGAAGAVIALAVWVAATVQGTRWLLTSVTSLSGGIISAQKIEGRIIDHLLLKGVRVTLAKQQVELDTVELRWKPLLMMAGTVALQELSLNGVRIRDDSPPATTAPVLAWPRVSDKSQLLDGSITRLRITEFSYRRLHQQPVLLTSFTGSVTWQGSLLSISDLKVTSPSGEITGIRSAPVAPLRSWRRESLAREASSSSRRSVTSRQNPVTRSSSPAALTCWRPVHCSHT